MRVDDPLSCLSPQAHDSGLTTPLGSQQRRATETPERKKEGIFLSWQIPAPVKENEKARYSPMVLR